MFCRFCGETIDDDSSAEIIYPKKILVILVMKIYLKMR